MTELTQDQKDVVVDWLSYLNDVPHSEIKSNSLLKDELGMDSLDVIDLICELEKAFSCNLVDQDFEYAKTVNDIYIILSKVI
jgi:acyl carrier protein